MRKIIFTILTLTSTFSFADLKEIDRDAVTLLMRENPSTVDGQRVNDLISSMMLSSFNSIGIGTLSVLTADCTAYKNKTFKCALSILNSDRKINHDGSYIPFKKMTESTLVIQYSVETTDAEPFVKLVGPVISLFAG